MLNADTLRCKITFATLLHRNTKTEKCKKTIVAFR